MRSLLLSLCACCRTSSCAVHHHVLKSARNISVTEDFRPMQMLDQLKGKQGEGLVGGLPTYFEAVLVMHTLCNLQSRFEADLSTSKVGASCLDSLYKPKDATCMYKKR